MIRVVGRYLYRNATSHRVSSGFQATALNSNFPTATCSRYDEENGRKEYHQNHNSRRHHPFFGGTTRFGAPLLGLSIFVTLKDMLGVEKIPQLDKDPLKDKVKQSMLDRRYGRYEHAIALLLEALNEARQLRLDQKELIVSRILDEIANTYYEKGDLDTAEKYFRDVIQRLIRLHGKTDSSPEFIGISLKLADIFGQKGDLDNAETGYKHCVRKQLIVMEEHLKKYKIDRGAWTEEKHPVEALGPVYTDPIALFGMALESYAHFLINNFGEERHGEAQEYFDEALKISFHVFGSFSFHSANLLNNFGAACIIRNRFELARKYLSLGIDRVIQINECAPMIVGYYCNYAEALFHTGSHDEALRYAHRAVQLSRSEPVKIKNYAEKFCRDLERDIRKAGKYKIVDENSSSWKSWIPGFT
jgi:tetratricopeptide (TPR) repeat protein